MPLAVNNMDEEMINNLIAQYLKNQGFSTRKLTDTPTDSLSVVNRKYVTLNGTTANRPTASVVGQYYFDTDKGKPIWWNGTAFVDATGTVI